MNLIRIMLAMVLSVCITGLFSTTTYCYEDGEFPLDTSKRRFNYYMYAQKGDNKQENTIDNKNDADTKKPDKKENQSGTDEAPDSSQVFNLTSNSTQYCMGKYKKLGETGYEIITVRCPEVTDKCTCEIDIKNFTEFVDCGGIRKLASKGSEIRECDTLITGN